MVSPISVAVLCVLTIGCLAQDPEPCCIPTQWQADLSQARAVLGGAPVPLLVTLSNRAYVDIPNQRAAISVEQRLDDVVQRFRIIQDYSANIQYVITEPSNGNPLVCEREETVLGTIDPCALRAVNATFMRSMVLGLNLESNMWRFELVTPVIQMTAYTTVATASCIPVHLLYAGALIPTGTPIMSSITYSDYVLGPVDDGIFALPPECQAMSHSDNVRPVIPDWVQPWFQHLSTRYM
ncbi:unnamed protein product [Owenia fusiformis]|uniref:Uncharacterized protein n=1 Tax=Owenia fusiformis TaxID=6347 RepID=A0A8J1U6F2_OWEFU|nr:unnamed protein product [Owenia fusiformis]